MVVSNILLKKIVRECCRSLSYNDEERQFTFSLKPYLESVWDNIKDEIKVAAPDFYLNDFNKLLSRLSDPLNQYIRVEVGNMADAEILNGEVLEVSLVSKQNPIRLVKMKNGQYLNTNSGKGYTLGRNFEFVNGARLRTSEGDELGVINFIALLSPSREHYVLSSLFIRNYYRNKISESIWPIFNKVVEDGVPQYNTDLTVFLEMARKMGIHSFSLLNILNAGACTWR